MKGKVIDERFKTKKSKRKEKSNPGSISTRVEAIWFPAEPRLQSPIKPTKLRPLGIICPPAYPPQLEIKLGMGLSRKRRARVIMWATEIKLGQKWRYTLSSEPTHHTPHTDLAELM